MGKIRHAVRFFASARKMKVITHQHPAVKFQVLLPYTKVQRVYNDLLVNRARKKIYPIYYGTSDKVGLMLIGDEITVSGHDLANGYAK